MSAFEKYMLSLDPLSRTSHEIALRSAHTEVQSLSQPYLWCGVGRVALSRLCFCRETRHNNLFVLMSETRLFGQTTVVGTGSKVTERHGRRNVLFAYLGQYEDLQFLDLVGLPPSKQTPTCSPPTASPWKTTTAVWSNGCLRVLSRETPI